jgi:hypothetical protein
MPAKYYGQIIADPQSKDYGKVVQVGRVEMDLPKDIFVSERLDADSGAWVDDIDVFGLVSGVIDGGLDWHEIKQNQVQDFESGKPVVLEFEDAGTVEKVLARQLKIQHKGPGDHPSGSPQSVHGKKGPRKEGEKDIRKRLSEEGIKSLIDRMQEAKEGEEVGFSYQVIKDMEPTTGVFSSEYPDRNKNVSLEELDYDVVREYVIENADLLTQDDHYLGGWLQYGKVDLDVSKRFDSRDAALKSAEIHYQAGVFDLNEFKTYYVRPEFDRDDPRYDPEAVDKWRAGKSVFK